MSALAAVAKPRAVVSGSYVVLGSGKVRVTVTSNVKKVKLTYRTAKNRKRTATITIRTGTGAKTLAQGSKSIVAQAKASSKLRAGIKTPIGPYLAPVVTPPVVQPPVVNPGPVVPPVTPPVGPPPPADATAPPIPVGVSAVGGDGQASVSWAGVAAGDLAGYQVSQASDPDGPWSRAASAPQSATRATVTGLANGTQLWFRVTALDTTGNESSPSVPVSAVPAAEPLPPSTTAFLDPARQTKVSAGEFTVTIPPGTVTGSGVPMTVTPLPEAADGSPVVDVHIHGAWDPAAGGVTVTMPWVHGTNPRAAPVMAHLAADGLRLSAGTGVHLDAAAGTVTATLGSLSPTYAAYVDCGSAVGFSRWVACLPGNGWTDYYTNYLWQKYAEDEIAGLFKATYSDYPPCPAVGTAASPGLFRPGLSCQTAIGGDASATWTFTNRAAYDIFFYEGGAVYRADARHRDTSSWTAEGQAAEVTGIVGTASTIFDDSLLFPGGTYRLTKQPNSGETELRLVPDVKQTMLWTTLQEIEGLALGLDPTHAGETLVGLQCAGQTDGEMDPAYVDCVQDAVAGLAKNAIGTVPVIGALILGAGSIAKAIGDVAVASTLETTQAQLRNYDPVAAPPADPRTGDSYIARDPSTSRAVLVEGGTVRGIVDGGTFLCLAQTRAVWDIGALAPLDEQPATPAQCDNTGRANWDIHPGGNVGTNVILRNPTGSAWLINTTGQIQTIPDGGTYVCLATTNPVIWNTSDDKIAAWTPVGNVSATCGANLVRQPIAATEFHSCAVLAGGGVTCWGFNGSGELGDGSTNSATAPVTAVGISDATTVTAGAQHSCALLKGGTVACWGDNTVGQLGNGSSGPSATPVPVSDIAGVTALASGRYHSCALTSDGEVACWGSNENGALGLGHNTFGSRTPVAVPGLKGATALAAGANFTCALLPEGGTVKCWGYNAHGELGNGTTTNSITPVEVISNATAVTAELYHACALLATRTITCWGYNGNGELGDGTNTDSSTPVPVSGIADATAVTAGYIHSCALLAVGTIKCWGDNEQGGLGDGTTASSFTPVAVSGISDATDLAAGLGYSCALLAGGAIKCWGYNGHGELGDGTTTNSTSPVAVFGIAGLLHP